MFSGRDFAHLVQSYGYAVANGRDHVAAIREDFERALFGSAIPDYGVVSFNDNPTADAELQIYPPNEILIAASYSHIQVAQCGNRIIVFDLVVFGTSNTRYDVSIEDVYEHSFAA